VRRAWEYFNSTQSFLKILLVNSLFRDRAFGGAEISVDLLAKGLVAAGHNVTVACLDRRKNIRESHPDGVTVIRQRIPNVFWQYDGVKHNAPARLLWQMLDNWNPGSYRHFRSVVRLVKPDLVHTNVLQGFSTSVWAATKAEGIPIVHTLRDLYLTCARSTRYRNSSQCSSTCFDCRVFTATRRRSCRHVSAFVGISQYVLDSHREILPSAPIKRVIFNSVPEPGSNERAATRIRSPRLRVGLLGRIAREKGFVEFAQAFSGRKNLQATLSIGGDGEPDLIAALAKLAAEDSRIQLAGRVNAYSFLSSLDVLVVPSRWGEAFGRIIVEAYAVGVPVLGRHVGGMPEIIDENKTGVTFSTDQECLAQLENLWNKPDLLSHWQKGAAKKGNEFGIDLVASKYESVYRDVIEKTTGAKAGNGHPELLAKTR
jgi:glycosyltransferase involved in cell wall biosynthesis